MTIERLYSLKRSNEKHSSKPVSEAYSEYFAKSRHLENVLNKRKSIIVKPPSKQKRTQLHPIGATVEQKRKIAMMSKKMDVLNNVSQRLPHHSFTGIAEGRSRCCFDAEKIRLSAK